jgi:hypothetical protein
MGSVAFKRFQLRLDEFITVALECALVRPSALRCT